MTITEWINETDARCDNARDDMHLVTFEAGGDWQQERLHTILNVDLPHALAIVRAALAWRHSHEETAEENGEALVTLLDEEVD